MTKIIILLFLPLALFAQIKVAVSYPYIGALAEAIGTDRIKVTVLAKGNWDPHFIVPRPSLISKLRQSDALIMNGAQLEIGWLPPLIKRASNRYVMPNSGSFLNLSSHISLIQKPSSVDRSLGDVHPEGNPHFHLDPHNILILAKSISDFFIRLDSEHSDHYKDNLQSFTQEWKKHLQRWDGLMQHKKGMKVIQFHDVLAYFNHAYALKTIATIEPLPGIPPSSRHTLQLIEIIERDRPSYLLHDVYHSIKTAEYIRAKTGIDIILMPHDINALESINSLSGLFDHLVEALQDD